MKIFLEYGLNENGEPVHISTVDSGKTELQCPYCGAELTANKGKQLTHHFHHKGATCKQSQSHQHAFAGWHHFDFNLPRSIVNRLIQDKERTGNNDRYYGRRADLLAKYDLIKETSGYIPKLTPKAMVAAASYCIYQFSDWMRQNLQQRYSDIKKLDVPYRDNLLLVEACRQSSLYLATLYLFEFEMEDGLTILKVGRTTRELSERLKEVRADVEEALDGVVKTNRILASVPNAGYVEKYALYSYREFQFLIGSHTEFLKLPESSRNRLLWEFTRLDEHLSSQALTTHERNITTGRWRYEQKRLACSKEGIKAVLKRNEKFGRPKGTTLSDDALLKKHSDIVSLLSTHPIDEIVAQTGKSRSTVFRVKKIITQT